MTDATERLKAENAELTKRLEEAERKLSVVATIIGTDIRALKGDTFMDTPSCPAEAAFMLREEIKAMESKLASLTAQLAAAEGERLDLQRRYEAINKACDIFEKNSERAGNAFDEGYKAGVTAAQREAAELRELVKAYRNALVEIADWSEDSYGRTQNACSAIANKALARLTPAKPSLEQCVQKLVATNAVHVRKGTVLGKESWSTVIEHLREEVQELAAATVEVGRFDPRNNAVEELGDILGIVVHAAVKLGVSMSEVERIEIEKLSKRFAAPAKPAVAEGGGK